ncbi:MAG: metal-dependent hydrolase [Anaerolineales bacterium]|jgi:L-ascorbate metabolism protein UlaG (beta-lactamase superfamily)
MGSKFIWYGHGTFGLETGGYKVLIDPFFTGNPAASTTADAVEADFIVVSHGHGDHISDAVDVAKRTGALVISNDEIVTWLGKQGVEAHPQHIGGGFNHPFGYLKLTHALHGSGLPDGSYGGNPAGLLLTTKEAEKIYMACDTGLFSSMKLIGEEGIDLAVLPIGDNFTMGPDDALRAVKLIMPKHVIPVHYSTFEVIKQDPHAWAQRVEAESDAKAHVLNPGDSFSL